MKSLKELMSEYEDAGKHYFQNNVPVIIRLDGRSFTNFTKSMKFEFPYSVDFNESRYVIFMRELGKL